MKEVATLNDVRRPVCLRRYENADIYERLILFN